MHEVRERYYVGAYNGALTYSAKVKPRNDVTEAEKKGLEARSWLATGKYSQLKDKRESPDASERCTALMAMFLKQKDGPQKRKHFDALLQLAQSSKDLTATYLAAAAAAALGNIVDAIEITKGCGQTPDIMALRTQFFLLLHRTDLAGKQLREVSQLADDHAVAKVASALVHLGTGNYQEAFLLFCDLEAQYGEDLLQHPSAILLNGKICAQLQRGNWEDACEDLARLNEAAPNDTDTLINLAVCAAHRGQSDWEAHVDKLRQIAPEHHISQKLTHLEATFANFVK